MILKWCFGTFLLLFISLASVQKNTPTPNQEIVLEFLQSKTTTKEIKNTIANLEQQLIKIGVSNIKIQKNNNGKLKITYYSKNNIEKIRQTLIADSSYSKDQNNKDKQYNFDYTIDVYELNDYSSFSNLEDHFIFDVKYNSDQFYSDTSFPYVRNNSIEKANFQYKTTYKVNKDYPFTEDYTSYKNPEVRAGPNCYFI